MSAFIRHLPAVALLWPWLIDLATWLVARSLNMPAPLVETAGIFVFLKAQAFENRIGKLLCPLRLWRRLSAYMVRT
jgi:hypothetical protein